MSSVWVLWAANNYCAIKNEKLLLFLSLTLRPTFYHVPWKGKSNSTHTLILFDVCHFPSLFSHSLSIHRCHWLVFNGLAHKVMLLSVQSVFNTYVADIKQPPTLYICLFSCIFHSHTEHHRHLSYYRPECSKSKRILSAILTSSWPGNSTGHQSKLIFSGTWEFLLEKQKIPPCCRLS